MATPYRYAFRYECPQIICFDGAHMLMLQIPRRDSPIH